MTTMMVPAKAHRPIVITPTDPVVQEAVRDLRLDNVDMVKIEPSCSGNAEAYVTNKDYLGGDPMHQRIIHLCYPKIMGQFKKTLGKAGYNPANPEHQKHLKEVVKAHLENVTLPHESEHIRQEEELGGKFPANAEQLAERVENPEAMKALGIVERMASSVERLDLLAEQLESLGFNSHAEALDRITERVLKLASEKGSSDFFHGEKADRALNENDLADVALVARSRSKHDTNKEVLSRLKVKYPDIAPLLMELAEMFIASPEAEKNSIRNMYMMLCLDRNYAPKVVAYIQKHRAIVNQQPPQPNVPQITQQIDKLAAVLDVLAGGLEKVGNVSDALEFDKISDSLEALKEAMCDNDR